MIGRLLTRRKTSDDATDLRPAPTANSHLDRVCTSMRRENRYLPRARAIRLPSPTVVGVETAARTMVKMGKAFPIQLMSGVRTREGARSH